MTAECHMTAVCHMTLSRQLTAFCHLSLRLSIISIGSWTALRLTERGTDEKYNEEESRRRFPSKHDTLHQCWSNVGPAS